MAETCNQQRGEREFMSLLLGPRSSPPLLLTVKGQLPSPTALYESKFSVPHKAQLNQTSLPSNRSSGHAEPKAATMMMPTH